MQTAVIDASVVIKWFVKDEEEKPQALRLLKDLRSRQIELVVPDLLFYEVANAIKTFIKADRINVTNGRRYLRELLGLHLSTIRYPEIIRLTLNLANKLDVSVYDASYLALAKTQKAPFYTADEKLLNKVSKNFKKIYSLSSIEIEDPVNK